MGVATQHNVNLDEGLNVMKTTIMGNTSVMYTMDKDDIENIVDWFNKHQQTDQTLNQEQQQLKYDLGCNMIYFMHKDKRQVIDNKQYNGIVYVGRAGELSIDHTRLLTRLIQHVKRRDFEGSWNKVQFVVSSQDDIDEAIMNRLEYLFIEAAYSSKSYRPLNGRGESPHRIQGRPQAEALCMELVTQIVPKMLKDIGCSAFKETTSSSLLDDYISQLIDLDKLTKEIEKQKQTSKQLEQQNKQAGQTSNKTSTNTNKQPAFIRRVEQVCEVNTPENAAEAVLNTIDWNDVTDRTVFLNIACKDGAFIRALIQRLFVIEKTRGYFREYGNNEDAYILDNIFRNQIFATATSIKAAELTRIKAYTCEQNGVPKYITGANNVRYIPYIKDLISGLNGKCGIQYWLDQMNKNYPNYMNGFFNKMNAVDAAAWAMMEARKAGRFPGKSSYLEYKDTARIILRAASGVDKKQAAKDKQEFIVRYMTHNPQIKLQRISALSVRDGFEKAFGYKLNPISDINNIDNTREVNRVVEAVYKELERDLINIFVIEIIRKEFGLMNIDVVIGNPPYQEAQKCIYPDFIDLGLKSGAKQLAMIVKNNWLRSNDLERIRNRIIKAGLEQVVNYPLQEEVFGDARVSVCIFKITSGYTGNLRYKEIRGGDIAADYEADIRNINSSSGSCEVIPTSKEQIEIINKLKQYINRYGNYSSNVRPAEAFRINSNGSVGRGEARKWLPVQDKPDQDHDIKVYFRDHVSYIERHEVPSRKLIGIVDDYKVICGRGINDDKTVLSNIGIIPPKSVCTATWGIVFNSPDKDTALRAAKYMQTRIVRYLIKLGSCDGLVAIGPDIFRFVPEIDLSAANSQQIPWTGTLEQIDNRLQQILGFSDEAMAEINSKVEYIKKKD